jgi:hypothetical protein
MLNPSKKSLPLKMAFHFGGLRLCGLYGAAPDFYVRYQTVMFGIRPTAPADSVYGSASPIPFF